MQNNNKRKSRTQSEICNDFLIFEANNPLDLGFAFGIETRDSDTDFDSDGLIMLFHSRISVENRYNKQSDRDGHTPLERERGTEAVNCNKMRITSSNRWWWFPPLCRVRINENIVKLVDFEMWYICMPNHSERDGNMRRWCVWKREGCSGQDPLLDFAQKSSSCVNRSKGVHR